MLVTLKKILLGLSRLFTTGNCRNITAMMIVEQLVKDKATLITFYEKFGPCEYDIHFWICIKHLHLYKAPSLVPHIFFLLKLFS